jgi:hypothetical protein
VNTNAPPPLEATLIGNPQILPKPIADPEAANTNAVRELNSPRVAIKALLYVSYIFYVGQSSYNRPLDLILFKNK